MKRRNILIMTTTLAIVLVAVALLLYGRIRSGTIVLGLPSGELAFNSDRNGVWDVFVLDPDGIFWLDPLCWEWSGLYLR